MSCSNDPIVVIGIGCRFPGADNLREFWRVLVNGENHVTDVPQDRWNANDMYSEDQDAPGKTYTKKAGFIKNFAHFDNKLFGISESEAAQMDPQQRQVLECTYMALENAGITRQQIAGQNVGVFIGSMNSDFSQRMTSQSHTMNNYTVSGISASIISNRVSYVFNLTGPSMTIDTACSSSLVAIHQAVNAMKTGDCHMAICGGVNMLLHPATFIPLSKARMLSPTGQCHAFSASADGYTRGEGCGIVILKPLSQALKDKDNVWGTIATGLNQDGREVQPITAPSGNQQKQLLQRIYKKHSIDPRTVDYIEAHGTGTKRGDPVEVRSFGEFFGNLQTSKQRYLGSVKTNIGHLESAAGVAGLIKVLLMMKHNIIVPSLHCDSPNEELCLDKYHFVVPSKPFPWTSPNKVACLNSFGFGGANSHAVITQYINQNTEMNACDSSLIVAFSGSTYETLRQSIQEFLDSSIDAYDLKTIAFTSTLKREHFPFRKAFIVNNKLDLREQTEKWLMKKESSSQVRAEQKVVFVFCGMGTAWQGMCKDQLQKCNEFKAQIRKIDTSLKRFVSWSLMERFKMGFNTQDAEFGPIAIFACQIALARLWIFWGVKPSAVVGQSVGEVAAAHIAGVLTLDEAVKVIYHRTRVLIKAKGGKMLLIRKLDLDKVEQVVAKFKGQANVALFYSPTSCSVSGNAIAIERIKSELRKQHSDTILTDLPVACAYHSHHMDACRRELVSSLKDLQTQRPSIPMISTVDVNLGEGRLTSHAYWGLNLRYPVRFCQAIVQAASVNNMNLFLEIGPKQVLAAHMDDIFQNTKIPQTALPSLLVNGSHNDLLKSLTTLYELNMVLNWTSFHSETMTPTPVPTYAFSHKAMIALSEYGEEATTVSSNTSVHHLFVRKTQNDSKCNLSITPSNLGTIYEHKIKGIIVVPGATYVEAGFGILQVLNTRSPYTVSVSVKFFQPVILKSGQPTSLNLDLLYSEDNSLTEDVSFVVRNDDRIHAKGNIIKIESSQTERVDIQYIQVRCKEKVSCKDVYRVLEYSGLTYGDSFATIDYAFRGNGESLAKLKLSPSLKNEMENTVIHPAILDGMLQAAAATALERREFLPTELKDVKVARSISENMFVHSCLIDKSEVHNSFTLTLLSSDGCVIATIGRFTLRYIGKQHFSETAITYHQNMEPVAQIEYQEELDPKSTIFTDMDLEDLHLKQPVFPLGKIKQNCDDFPVESVLQDRRKVFVVFPFTELSTGTGDPLESELIRRVMPLRVIVLHLNRTESSIHLCVVSETKEPKSSTSKTGQEAASLCLWEGIKGFVRCVLREHTSLNIQMVEMYTEEEGDFKANLMAVMSNVTSDALVQHPEITFRNSIFYSNEIVPLEVEAPLFRMTNLSKTTNGVLLSRSEKTVLSPIFVSCDDESDQMCENDVEVVITNSTIHSPLLYPVTTKSGMLSKMHIESDLHPLLSFETTGYVSPQKGPLVHYISCFPIHVKKCVILPRKCLIAKKELPAYNSGLLIKLYLLWCICDAADMTAVAILYLPNTENLANALSTILTSRGSKSILLLTPNNITSMKSYPSTTLISTIQLTKDLIESLNHCFNFKNIVCVDNIISQSTIEHLTASCSSAKVTIVRPTELFSPKGMLESVPRMFRWVRVHSRKIGYLASQFQCSPCTDLSPNVKPINLTELLQTSEINLINESTRDKGYVKTTSSHLFQKTGSYLVVGGLTGLGWECVSLLASRGAGCVAILSRSKPSPERETDMNHLAENFGCNVVSIKADVTDFDELNQALLKLRKYFPKHPIKGVFYGAAVLADSSLLEMTEDIFRRASCPKVIGSWNLHVLLADTPLDFFVLHSSITSCIGNAGQSNYGAGNGFLDGLAICRQKCTLGGQSINWGPLNLGMLDGKTFIQKRLEAKGMFSIDKMYISQCLIHAIMVNEPQMAMCLFDLQKLAAQSRKDQERALLFRLRSCLKHVIKLMDEVKDETVTQRVPLDLDQLRGESSQTKKRLIQEYLVMLICDRALLDETKFDQNESLRDMGVDSMYAMEISGQILSDTGVSLSANELQFGSVERITNIMLEKLFTTDNSNESHEKNEGIVISIETITSSIIKPVLAQTQSGKTDLVIVSTIKVPDAANVTILKAMAKESISRHLTARTSFKDFQDCKSWNILSAEQALDFRIISESDHNILRKNTEEALDTEHQGPLRFIFIERRHQLRFIFHRLAFDLQGCTLMIKEFVKFGEALAKGLSLDEVPRDPDIDSTGEIQKAIRQRHEELSQFWKHRPVYTCYSSLTEPLLNIIPTEEKDFSVQDIVDRELYTMIMRLGNEQSLSPFYIMSAVFQLLLSFVSNTSSSTVLFPVDLRVHIPTMARFVGRCTNYIPMITNMSDENITVGDYIQSNKASTEAFVKHGLFPFEEIQALMSDDEKQHLYRNFFIFNDDMLTGQQQDIADVEHSLSTGPNTECYMFVYHRKIIGQMDFILM